jgi:hypothetical protein
MVQRPPVSNREQVVDTMVGLTRLSNLHRAIAAGGDSMECILRSDGADSFAWPPPRPAAFQRGSTRSV